MKIFVKRWARAFLYWMAGDGIFLFVAAWLALTFFFALMLPFVGG